MEVYVHADLAAAAMARGLGTAAGRGSSGRSASVQRLSASGGCRLRLPGFHAESPLEALRRAISEHLHLQPNSYVLTCSSQTTCNQGATLAECGLDFGGADAGAGGAAAAVGVLLLPRRRATADAIFVGGAEGLYELEGVPRDATLGHLRTLIAKITRAPPGSQVLWLGGRELGRELDGEPLVACGVGPRCLLVARQQVKPRPVRSSISAGNLEVRLSTGHAFEVACRDELTLSWLKAQVLEDAGIPVKDQGLFHQGRLLQGDLSFSDCGLQPGSQVQVVVRAESAAALWPVIRAHLARRAAPRELASQNPGAAAPLWASRASTPELRRPPSRAPQASTEAAGPVPGAGGANDRARSASAARASTPEPPRVPWQEPNRNPAPAVAAAKGAPAAAPARRRPASAGTGPRHGVPRLLGGLATASRAHDGEAGSVRAAPPRPVAVW